MTSQPEHEQIKLRRAQRKRIEILSNRLQAAKTELDEFVTYVAEDLEIPDGWRLVNLDIGFVPPEEKTALPKQG